MQPRLVAISYPSSQDDGNGSGAGSHNVNRNSKRYSRVLGQSKGRSGSRSQSRQSRRLSAVSWQELRSQFSVNKHKHSAINDEVRYSVLKPWSEDSENADTMPPPTWDTLPIAVQTNILGHLEKANEESYGINLWQSRRRDLVAVQLSCKAWANTAQKHLYETIHLESNNDHDRSPPPPKPTPRFRHFRKLTLKWGRKVETPSSQKLHHAQMLQLRQTLQSVPHIAKLVKHLVLSPQNQEDDKKLVEYSDLVASVVVSCPSLETFTGFYILYTHSFNRLFHSLSTRTGLRQHTWVIGEDNFVRTRAARRYSTGILSTQQNRLFLQQHALWKKLETLNIVSHEGKGVLEHHLLTRALKILPSLKHLRLSSFDPNDFSNKTLRALPALRSLTLDQCSGVTESGLCSWAESPAASNIQKLVLEDQQITSLLTIAALFSALTKLEIFHMGQSGFEPGLPLEFDVEQPLLSSDSLKTLEWCVTSTRDAVKRRSKTIDPKLLQPQSPSKSNQLVLSSILEFGFPHLKRVVLPGYGNLNGLLRWLRHTAWANQNLKAPTHRLSHSGVSTNKSTHHVKRNTVYLSHRPSSPNFDQYDQWRRPQSSHPILAMIPDTHNEDTISQPDELERPKSSHAVLEASEMQPRTPPQVDQDPMSTTPTTIMTATDSTAVNTPTRLEDLTRTDTTSTSDSSSTAETDYSPPAALSNRSSTSTLHPVVGSPEYVATYDFGTMLSVKKIDETPRLFDVEPTWAKKRAEVGSTHSSISLLLEGYAWTA